MLRRFVTLIYFIGTVSVFLISYSSISLPWTSISSNHISQESNTPDQIPQFLFPQENLTELTVVETSLRSNTEISDKIDVTLDGYKMCSTTMIHIYQQTTKYTYKLGPNGVDVDTTIVESSTKTYPVSSGIEQSCIDSAFHTMYHPNSGTTQNTISGSTSNPLLLRYTSPRSCTFRTFVIKTFVFLSFFPYFAVTIAQILHLIEIPRFRNLGLTAQLSGMISPFVLFLLAMWVWTIGGGCYLAEQLNPMPAFQTTTTITLGLGWIAIAASCGIAGLQIAAVLYFKGHQFMNPDHEQPVLDWVHMREIFSVFPADTGLI